MEEGRRKPEAAQPPHRPGWIFLRQPEFRSRAFKRWGWRKLCGINRFLTHRKSRQFRGDPKNLTDPCPLRCQRLCIARTVKERQVLFPHPNVKFRRHGKNIVR